MAEVVPTSFVTGDPVPGRHDVTLSANEGFTLNFGNLKPNTPPVKFQRNDFPGCESRCGQTILRAGLTGWKVYIDLNNNSVFDTGEPSTLTNMPASSPSPTSKPAVTLCGRSFRLVGGSVTSSPGLRLLLATTSRASILPRRKRRASPGRFSSTPTKTPRSTAAKPILPVGRSTSIQTTNPRQTRRRRKVGDHDSERPIGLREAAGTYVVRIVQQANYALTTAGSYKLTLSSGQVAASANFGSKRRLKSRESRGSCASIYPCHLTANSQYSSYKGGGGIRGSITVGNSRIKEESVTNRGSSADGGSQACCYRNT